MPFNVEDNTKKRIESMDEFGYDITNRYLDYLRASYNDKQQRGINDLFVKADMYWDGRQNELKNSPDAPGSNVNILNAQIESLTSYIATESVSIEALGQEPSDHMYAERVEKMLDWVNTKNKPTIYMDVFVRRLLKYGTSAFKVWYDEDWNKGFGLPRIETVNPGYLYIDPTITNMAYSQDAAFVIEAQNRSKFWARNQKRFDQDMVETISSGYDIAYFRYLFGEDITDTWDLENDEYIHLYVYTKVKAKIITTTIEEEAGIDENGNPFFEEVEMKEVVESDDGDWLLRLVEMSGDGFVLYDSFETNETFPNNMYPYFMTGLMPRDGTIWSKSFAELLFDPQDIINDIDDQIRMSLRLTGNPQKLVSTDSNIDIGNLTNESGLVIPTTNINGMKYLNAPPFPQYGIDRRNTALQTEVPIVSNFSFQMSGQRQKGVDTATEALQLQQSGMTKVDHIKALIQEGAMQDMFIYMIEVIMDNWTEEKMFRITNEKGEQEFMAFNPSELTKVPVQKPATRQYQNAFQEQNPEMAPEELPKWMNAEGNFTKSAQFDIKISIGAGLPKNKGFMYQLINEMAAKQVISPEQYLKLVEQYIGIHIPPMEPGQQPVGQQNMPGTKSMGGMPVV